MDTLTSINNTVYHCTKAAPDWSDQSVGLGITFCLRLILRKKQVVIETDHICLLE
jgi:hypothetical protein